MRKSELKRSPAPPRKTELSRKSSMKRSQPKRDWGAARAKCENEEDCRLGHLGGCEGVLEAAHIIGRYHDRFNLDRQDWQHRSVWMVYPERIVPLCSHHHYEYDHHRADLLPVLTPHEELQAHIDAGSLLTALKRLTGDSYAPVGSEREENAA
jgi:hypothetical protein